MTHTSKCTIKCSQAFTFCPSIVQSICIELQSIPAVVVRDLQPVSCFIRKKHWGLAFFSMLLLEMKIMISEDLPSGTLWTNGTFIDDNINKLSIKNWWCSIAISKITKPISQGGFTPRSNGLNTSTRWVTHHEQKCCLAILKHIICPI